jgi:hypothetical protein
MWNAFVMLLTNRNSKSSFTSTIVDRRRQDKKSESEVHLIFDHLDQERLVRSTFSGYCINRKSSK